MNLGTKILNNKEILDAVNKRRNFAIISHPDAGKTTLTEKLLLYGGAIQQAGAVKARVIREKLLQTGWNLRNGEVFLLHQLYCNLNMKDQ